jgi:hypothetical protein
MRSKIKKRMQRSFLFRKRCCGLSISDGITILLMLAVCVYGYRHLNVGF